MDMRGPSPSAEVNNYLSPERLELLRSFRLDNGANGMTSSMASRYEVLD
jgi:hypothetical protein